MESEVRRPVIVRGGFERTYKLEFHRRSDRAKRRGAENWSLRQAIQVFSLFPVMAFPVRSTDLPFCIIISLAREMAEMPDAAHFPTTIRSVRPRVGPSLSPVSHCLQIIRGSLRVTTPRHPCFFERWSWKVPSVAPGFACLSDRPGVFAEFRSPSVGGQRASDRATWIVRRCYRDSFRVILSDQLILFERAATRSNRYR